MRGRLHTLQHELTTRPHHHVSLLAHLLSSNFDFFFQPCLLKNITLHCCPRCTKLLDSRHTLKSNSADPSQLSQLCRPLASFRSSKSATEPPPPRLSKPSPTFFTYFPRSQALQRQGFVTAGATCCLQSHLFEFVCLLSHRLKVHSFASPECDHGTPCKIWRCKRIVQKLDCGQNGSYATVANINREAKRGSTQKLTTPSILHADLSIQARDPVFVYPRIGQRGLVEPQTCASSLACASPLAVITDVEFLNFRRVSSSAELESFSLIMCVDARKSHEFSLLGLFRGGSRHCPCLVGEWNVALSLVFELKDNHRSCCNVL